jgi:hypothetical protein
MTNRLPLQTDKRTITPTKQGFGFSGKGKRQHTMIELRTWLSPKTDKQASER